MIYQRPIPVSRIGHDAVANGSAADRAYVFLAPRGGLRREAVSRYCCDRNGSKRIRPCDGRGVGAMRGLLLTWLALIALGGGAKAADVSASMPTKAPPQTAPVAYDWTGFYAGVHLAMPRVPRIGRPPRAERRRRCPARSICSMPTIRSPRPAAICTDFRRAITTDCHRTSSSVPRLTSHFQACSAGSRHWHFDNLLVAWRHGRLPGYGRILRHAARAHRLLRW